MEPASAGPPAVRHLIRRRTSLRERLRAWARRAAVGPLELLSGRRHPMVRAEMRRARRANLVAGIACAVAPLLACAAAALAAAPSPVLSTSGRIFSAVFVALWPVVLLTGAAMRSAGAVLAEREDDTAIQIVLTLMPKSAIAAAKVVPHAVPFLWSAVATLPLYSLVGEQLLFHGERWPAVASVWPLRLLGLTDWEAPADFTARGFALGALMSLTDAGLVWMAAHWGAALAVRTGSLVQVILRLAGRLLLLGLLFLFYHGAACMGYLLVLNICAFLPDRIVRDAPTLWFSLPFFLALWWLYPLGDAGRSTLSAFAWFDWLAMDQFERHKRGGIKAWRSRQQDVPARL